jgi:hypothetical protein
MLSLEVLVLLLLTITADVTGYGRVLGPLTACDVQEMNMMIMEQHACTSSMSVVSGGLGQRLR